jgi:hypothetical protein
MAGEPWVKLYEIPERLKRKPASEELQYYIVVLVTNNNML